MAPSTRVPISIFLRFALIFFCIQLPGSGFGALPQSAVSPGRFENLAKKAEEAQAQDKLAEAAKLYKQALALSRDWQDGWWALGALEYDQDHYAAAAQAFAKLIALNSANGTAHAMLGLCQFELQEDVLARQNLLQAEEFGVIKDDQLRKVALYHLGILQLRARKFTAAKQIFGQLASEGLNSKELINSLGLASLFLHPLEAPPPGTEGASIVERVGEAEVLMARKQFDQAKKIYAELMEQSPDYPNLHFAFGRCLLDTHDTGEAVEEFQRELHRDPKHVNSLLEMAAVNYLTNSEVGLKFAEQAANLAPKLPFAHYLLGLLRLDTGDARGAIPELRIANQAFPSEPNIYFSLGKAYARAGRNADAAKARAEFMRLNAEAAEHPGTIAHDDHPAIPGVSPPADATANP